jgi:hypothetical protein
MRYFDFPHVLPNGNSVMATVVTVSEEYRNMKKRDYFNTIHQTEKGLIYDHALEGIRNICLKETNGLFLNVITKNQPNKLDNILSLAKQNQNTNKTAKFICQCLADVDQDGDEKFRNSMDSYNRKKYIKIHGLAKLDFFLMTFNQILPTAEVMESITKYIGIAFFYRTGTLAEMINIIIKTDDIIYPNLDDVKAIEACMGTVFNNLQN